MTTTLAVVNRIATISTDEKIVAGNTYAVTLSLDSEWTGTYYVRVRFGSLYYDIPASGSSVDVQIPVGYPEVGLGIYSENIGICTNEVRVKVLRSILEQGVSVVEFDTDLYNQWQNEVSELVCDSDFDAESDRPVKNSVLTAWKNTVPLDSALVHKTGAETIAGGKIFTNTPTVRSNSTTVLNLESMADSSASTTRARFSILSNGTERGRVFQYKNQSVEQMGIRQYRIDTSGFFDMVLTATSDGRGYVTVPTFTADNNADDKVVTRAMLASTPTIVHTTGIETIAGEKSFTETLRAYKYRCEDATAYGSTANKGAFVFVAKNEQGVMVDYASAFLWQTLTGDAKGNSLAVHVRSLDGTRDLAPLSLKVVDADSYTTRVGVMSHLPVGTGGVHLAPDGIEVINSEMLAVDPRVIHTTGNETIAGIKSTTSSLAILSNSMDLDSPPSYTGRTFKEFKVKQGTQVVVREDATLASTGNSHRVIVHAHKADGTDISATLSVVTYRDGTAKLAFIRPDGTEVVVVPRG